MSKLTQLSNYLSFIRYILVIAKLEISNPLIALNSGENGDFEYKNGSCILGI